VDKRIIVRRISVPAHTAVPEPTEADEFRRITDSREWARKTPEILGKPVPPDPERAAFSTHWVVAGHHIREQVADDALLVRLLRHLLPPYKGGALTLFRGENLPRWEKGAVGLAWTDKIDVARMFGGGLNARDTGGVLLRGAFGPAAIISGSDIHSRYLGEMQFTIDPFYGTDIDVLERYPPCDPPQR
jgi:hypothetical protein